METQSKFPTNLEDIEKLAYRLIAEKGHPERADGWTHEKARRKRLHLAPGERYL
jgi:hypothetical protein